MLPKVELTPEEAAKQNAFGCFLAVLLWPLSVVVLVNEAIGRFKARGSRPREI